MDQDGGPTIEVLTDDNGNYSATFPDFPRGGRGEVRYGNGSDGPHEATWLALEVAKSTHNLGVKARWDLTESIENSMSWYRAQYEGEGARALCEAQIGEYESLP